MVINKEYEEMVMKRCDIAFQESAECMEFEKILESKRSMCDKELLEAQNQLLGLAEVACYKKGFQDAMNIMCSRKM